MELETRKCRCGCEREWSCLPTSTSTLFSNVECPDNLAKKKPGKMKRLEFENRKRDNGKTAKGQWKF